MPPIPPEVYDREYFLSDRCEGWQDFQEERGLSTIKRKQLAMLDVRPGMRVLDAGCGRGEMLLACSRLGAGVAGLDYAEAAVELTRETLAGVEGADIQRGDVTALPWPDASFDRILFGDVIEHLDPPDTVPALGEFHRVLKPGGTLLVHTAPNLLFLKVTWPLARPALRLLGRGSSAEGLDGWLAEAESYHVNEQSVFTMRRSLRAAGFAAPRVWIDPDVLRSGDHHLTGELTSGPLMGLVTRIARLRPVRLLLGNDVYALARNSHSGCDPLLDSRDGGSHRYGRRPTGPVAGRAAPRVGRRGT